MNKRESRTVQTPALSVRPPSQPVVLNEDVEVGLLQLLAEHGEDVWLAAEAGQMIHNELQQQLEPEDQKTQNKIRCEGSVQGFLHKDHWIAFNPAELKPAWLCPLVHASVTVLVAL